MASLAKGASLGHGLPSPPPSSVEVLLPCHWCWGPPRPRCADSPTIRVYWGLTRANKQQPLIRAHSPLGDWLNPHDILWYMGYAMGYTIFFKQRCMPTWSGIPWARARLCETWHRHLDEVPSAANSLPVALSHGYLWISHVHTSRNMYISGNPKALKNPHFHWTCSMFLMKLWISSSRFNRSLADDKLH